MKIKPSWIGDITLSFTDIGESCPTPQMCLLPLFAKIKFSRKFPNLLSYMNCILDAIALYKIFVSNNESKSEQAHDRTLSSNEGSGESAQTLRRLA